MSGSDPNDQAHPTDLPQTPPTEQPAPSEDVAATDEAAETTSAGPEGGDATPRRRILIGSQRDPDAYRPKRQRDWKPIAEPHKAATGGRAEPVESTAPTAAPAEPIAPPDVLSEPTSPPPSTPVGKIPPPNIRDVLPTDLEDEFNEVLSGASFDDLMCGGSAAEQAALEEESQHTGRVLMVHGDDVFIELGRREQGVVSAKQFDHLPEPGTMLDVIVRRFNVDEGLYELSIPNAAAEVGDWDDLHEGMIVEARVTGHNTGGLECDVNHLRAFIPVSQVALYRVDNLAQFVDEKFTCVVTEANPRQRNLVLSRRAVLEREKQEAREKLLQSLQPGQIHEGVVRKLTDFGAFVDLGGIDGLLHVSQLAWHRVSHPSEVLSEGQTIKVKIEKIDHATGKMSLAYRDMLENPWQSAARKYPPNTVAKGKVSKIMEFGAFVELEPGVEGLVHISELSHKRVWRATDVVSEGDEIEVLVLSVDPQAQRMSLSMKELSAPEPAKKGKEPEPGELPSKSSKRKKPSKPLKGGLGRSAGGESFGLKW